MEDKDFIEQLERLERRVQKLEGDYKDISPPDEKTKVLIKIMNGEGIVEIANDLDLTPARVSQIKLELKQRLN